MPDVSAEQLLDLLGYAESPNYVLTSGPHHPLTAHLFRAAHLAGVDGAYVFHTSPDDSTLPVRPAVYFATAASPIEARAIHRSLWNLGNAPFLIVLLPQQIRVYTGFDYSHHNEKRGLIEILSLVQELDFRRALADYTADSIDSGRLWREQATLLRPENRVDTRLLKHLTKLEENLVNDKLDLPTAHALIGKYVYIRYLHDRKILSPQWLDDHAIDIDSVLGRKATLRGLHKLIDTLDERFNGHIFPFPVNGNKYLTDEHVALVAAAFKGDDPLLRQMHLDFESYDFSYIPVETLSAIYEQFLHSQGTGKTVGAIYTPEYLADYLIAELNHVRPVKSGMKILDPCCGSGMFLVLAYRKLIEMELANRAEGKLRPSELRHILTQSIFGVERNPDACYVTELSLILTMLHYVAPPDLHRNKQFHFPDLHNKQIFQADFFDDASEFWKQGKRFDWIVGNPPWIEPESDSQQEQLVLNWINDKKNRRQRPVAGNRVAEAFSWRAGELITQDGYIGLIIHATSLFNHESKKYRKLFFNQHEVSRISNFANLAFVLFGGRGIVPAATIIYTKALSSQEKPPIIHYGPFAVNQMITTPLQGASGNRQSAWALTINENEIQTVSPDEAESGDAVTWKLALWGTHRDKRALQRLQRIFTLTLDELAEQRRWTFNEGVRLMECPPQGGEKGKYKIEAAPELEGKKYFDADVMVKSGRRFSIPANAFQEIPARLCFIRTRSGKASLEVNEGAHVLLNNAYFTYSDESFIIRAPHKRLSVPPEDAEHLRALSVFLSSALMQYHLFFHSPAWGIERNRIYVRDIKKLPVPSFSSSQIAELADLHRHLLALETTVPSSEVQTVLDQEIKRILRVPDNLSILADDFIRVRLTLNHGNVREAGQIPHDEDLYKYGEILRDELDEFTSGQTRHRISLYSSFQSLVVCSVEVTEGQNPFTVIVEAPADHLTALLEKLNQKLHQQFSQWVYVRRGLRIFDDSRAFICKAPRLIDWTRTQALNDSDDLIAEVLASEDREHEVVLDEAR